MLIYVDEVLREIESIKELADLAREKIEQGGRTNEELLLDARNLQRRIADLAELLPEKKLIGQAGRHAAFMVYYLERDQLERCKSDFVDLVDRDLPGIVDSVRKWANELAYVDADLRSALAPLIRTRQFDSAIRKAFVVLKTRLCAKFSLDSSLDGADLVNTIFGKNSPYLKDLDPKTKAHYRDLFAGLFGAMRNAVAHNDLEPDLAELDTAVSCVNMCLRIVADFRKDPSDELF